MASPPRLPPQAEARTEKVEDLVERVRRSLVRVPGLAWLEVGELDVVELFDSIYRGYPIGALLFYKRSAETERLSLGPLVIEAPEIPDLVGGGRSAADF